MPPFVSVIIPCRNEEKFIAECLNSIISQDYPKEKTEVLVVDGMSGDKTREIVKNFQFSIFNFQLLDNPKKFTPSGLNIGIKNSRGEAIIRIDAHATYEKDYISKCVKHLKESGADNVGGVIKTLPAKNTLSAKAIAACLSHFFGVASSFRLGSEKTKEVDTVFGGCYKREVFEKIGLFNEKLIRSQDLEFNLRLKKNGGKIILVPDITAYYYPSSNFKDFLGHNFSDGIWVTYPLKFGEKPFGLRHLIPLLFILGIIASLMLSSVSKIFFLIFLAFIFLYLFLNLFFSLQISLKERDFRLLFLLPIAFMLRHFGYGIGSLLGFVWR